MINERFVGNYMEGISSGLIRGAILSFPWMAEKINENVGQNKRTPSQDLNLENCGHKVGFLPIKPQKVRKFGRLSTNTDSLQSLITFL
jgi:hypothetical protein